jgi:hypothetical protein
MIIYVMMNTKNANSINCNNSQNENKERQNSDKNTVKVFIMSAIYIKF